jgi:hypothetical protein
MPHNSEGPPTSSREEFCLALKAARERQRITLDAIAETTKIPASVFAALERSDLRRWPKGLFRRSFFRDYVTTIGLPVAEACAEFARLFPDDDSAVVTRPAAVAAATQAEECRLALDAAWHGPRDSVTSRIAAALIDAGLVIFAAIVISLMTGLGAGPTIAIVALCYFSVATALCGESPVRWAIRQWSLLDGPAEEPAEQADPREWITDAYRVAPEPRLRVRIKMSQ